LLFDVEDLGKLVKPDDDDKDDRKEK
jgi:hypothetical protein